MVTMDEAPILADWLEVHMPSLGGLAVLDASKDRHATSRVLRSFAAACGHDIHVWHESEHPPASHSDQDVRAVALDLLRSKFGPSNWVMLCHADEFWYHEPALLAEVMPRKCTAVPWYALQVLPHPAEYERFVANVELPPLETRFAHFHYGTVSRRNSSSRKRLIPYVEWRLFRDNATLVRTGSPELGTVEWRAKVEYVSGANGTLPAKGLRRCLSICGAMPSCAPPPALELLWMQMSVRCPMELPPASRWPLTTRVPLPVPYLSVRTRPIAAQTCTTRWHAQIPPPMAPMAGTPGTGRVRAASLVAWGSTAARERSPTSSWPRIQPTRPRGSSTGASAAGPSPDPTFSRFYAWTARGAWRLAQADASGPWI